MQGAKRKASQPSFRFKLPLSKILKYAPRFFPANPPFRQCYMKPSGGCILVLFIWLVACFCAKADETMGLEDIFNEIAQTKPTNMVLGLEIDQLCRDKVVINDSLKQLTKSDLTGLAKLISEQTDYECNLGKDYMVIVPKINPPQHDMPLCRRHVSSPEVKGVDFETYLSRVSSSTPDVPVGLGGPLISEPGLAQGEVTLPASHNELCYQLLNNVARQIGANSWVMRHMLITYKGEKGPHIPVFLGGGDISFYLNR